MGLPVESRMDEEEGKRTSGAPLISIQVSVGSDSVLELLVSEFSWSPVTL